MSIMNALAVRQLKKNQKRTLLTLLGIILSVSMITAVAGFVISAKDMLRRTYIATKGDFHAGFVPVTKEQIASLALDERIESYFTKEERDKTGIYFRIKNVDRHYEETAETIAKDHALPAQQIQFIYNTELLAIEGAIANDNYTITLYSVGGILIAVILAGSVLVIANSFYISASERLRQFGMLKSIGATKEQIRQSVIFEAIALSVIGIPMGIVTGFAVEAVALAIANRLLSEVSQINDGLLYFKVVFSFPAVGVSVAISLVTIVLSAWLPAKKASQVSPIESIRLLNEIKMKPRQVKTSRLTQKLFGFEASLAAKALKRNKGKYRATVIAIVVSITLYIVSSGFGALLLKSADMIYTDYGINVILTYSNYNQEAAEKLNEKIMLMGGGTVSYAKYFELKVNLPSSFLSEDGRAYLGEMELTDTYLAFNPARIISVKDEDFQKLCESAHVSVDALQDSDHFNGILVNYSIQNVAGKRIEFQPFHNVTGETLETEDINSGTKTPITIQGMVSELPTSVIGVSDFTGLNIVVSHTNFAKSSAAFTTPKNMLWVVEAENPDAFSGEMDKLFGENLNKSQYFIYNYNEYARMNRNLNLLAMIFIYGFIGLLSLIAVTSVISTISTGINLRAQEFAMLSSVGMTPEGFKRMMNFESLLYGIKSLIIGLPIGMILYYFLFRMFGLSVQFGFIWPYKEIAICVAAVLLIIFSTMRYAVKKLKSKNIVETLKEVNI